MLEVLIKDKGEKSVLKIALGYVNTLLLMNHVLLLKSKKEKRYMNALSLTLVFV